MTGHCGSLPLLYVQPIMAHTSSKSLVELNTGEHETTFVNITQMLSSLTHTPRLKWLDNPVTTPSTSEAVQLQQAPTAPTVQPSVAPATPKQAAARSPTATASTYCSHSTTICCSRNTQASCSPKPYSSNPHPVEGTCNCRCSTTDWQN